MFSRSCRESLWLRNGTSDGSCRIGGRKFPGHGLFSSAPRSLLPSQFSFERLLRKSPLPRHTLPRELNCRSLTFSIAILFLSYKQLGNLWPTSSPRNVTDVSSPIVLRFVPSPAFTNWTN